MKTLNLKTITKSVIIATTMCAVSMPVMAKKHRQYDKQNHASYDYAKVVNVNPVYESYQVNHPVEKCYDKRVPVNQRSKHRNASYTNEIIGGVIGAAVGNQVGKNGGGKARDVATVIGGVLGASVARDIERNNSRYNSRSRDYQEVRYKVIQHCEVHDSYQTKREVVGYDVAYRYNGEVYHTHLDRHPGHKIRVRVSVKPV